MKYLLDTNVVSEWVKPRPHPGVAAWLAEVDEDRVLISVITLAELRHGIERLAVGVRRVRLDVWLRDDLPQRFEGRVLPADGAVADGWGKVVARSQAAGRPVGAMDAFVAATVEVHGMTLVTRNVSDFAVLGCAIINPWNQA